MRHGPTPWNGRANRVVASRYKDKAALAAHGKTEYFQAFSKKLAADKLVAAPLQIKMVKPFAGYSSRL
jgi:quinol monooxygenase YgiN